MNDLIKFSILLTNSPSWISYNGTDCPPCHHKKKLNWMCGNVFSTFSLHSHLGLHNILKLNVRSSEVCFSATCRFIGIVDYLNDSVKCIFVQIIIFQHNYYTSTLKNKGVLIVSIPWTVCCRGRPRKQKLEIRAELQICPHVTLLSDLVVLINLLDLWTGLSFYCQINTQRIRVLRVARPTLAW